MRFHVDFMKNNVLRLVQNKRFQKSNVISNQNGYQNPSMLIWWHFRSYLVLLGVLMQKTVLLDGHRGWKGNRIWPFLSLLFTTALHPWGGRLRQSATAQALISHPLWGQKREKQKERKKREIKIVKLWNTLAAAAHFYTKISLAEALHCIYNCSTLETTRHK